MIEARKTAFSSVTIQVELFGSARLAVGRRKVSIEVPRMVSVSEFIWVLAEAYPDLVGKAIRKDRTGLLDSFMLNLNGIEFIKSGMLRLESGDSLLIFSSQPGG